MILVCENNGFAEFTPRSAHTNVERVSDVVAPYGLERETVDGNDVVAVRDAFAGFLAAARGGDGPMLLECLTHRLRGHYEGDPQPTARRSRRRSGSSSTRSCGSSGAALEEGWLDEDGAGAARARGARRRWRTAVRLARESPLPGAER